MLCVVLETSWNDSFFIFPRQYHISFDGIVAVWSVKLCLKDQLTASDFQFFPKAPKSRKTFIYFSYFSYIFFFMNDPIAKVSYKGSLESGFSIGLDILMLTEDITLTLLGFKDVFP